MLQKIRTFLHYAFDSSVSKMFLVRYALGQLLAYSGIGQFISFHTPYYALYLTRSPVAMVLFGNPVMVRDEEETMETLVHTGDCVIDIGANIGTFSLHAASLVGTTGRVYAFEAHPTTVSFLRRNIKLNNARSVTIVPHALGDSSGEVSFSTETYDDVNHVVSKGGIRVPMKRLDDVSTLTEIARIRCIKIDVEGYELLVVRGGEQTLAKTDYIIFEAYEPNCQRFGYTLDELFAWFDTRGFMLLDAHTRTPIDFKTTGRQSVQNVLAQARSI